MAIRVFFLALLILPILLLPGDASGEEVNYRVIVKLRSGAEAAGLSEYSDRIDGLMRLEELVAEGPLFPEYAQRSSLSTGSGPTFPFDRYRVVVLGENADGAAVVDELGGLPDVEYAEFDYPIELYARPNDPGLVNEWGLENRGQQYLSIWRRDGYYNDTLVMATGTPGADIHVAATWIGSKPRVRPLVVIVDTGLDTEHPDITANLWSNPGEIGGNGIDDDRNGFIDDVHGWDFSGDVAAIGQIIFGDNDVSDSIGHGTHVAGTIGATSDNGIGVAGVCSEVWVVGLKIFPNALMSVASRAIVYATDIGAEVINMSWGSPYRSTILLEALTYARSHGVLPVAAAGNFSSDMSSFPAAFPVSFTVSGSNSDDEITWFSSFGSWVDIAAPGRDILSLRARGTDMYASSGEPDVRIIDSHYYLADGTSMSSPHVAGAAAVVLSYAPGLSPDQVQEILEQSADDIVYPYGDTDSIFVGWDRYSGHGRVNIEAALALLDGTRAKLQTPHARQMVTSDTDITGSAYSESGDSYSIDLSLTSDQSTWENIASGIANIVDGKLGFLSTAGRTGDYTLRLSVGDEFVTYRRFIIASERHFNIDSPEAGDTVSWFLTVRGSVVDPEFIGYKVFLRPGGQGNQVPNPVTREISQSVSEAMWAKLGQSGDNFTQPSFPDAKQGSSSDEWDLVFESTRLVADSILCGVSLGSYQSGDYTLRVAGYTPSEEVNREIEITIEDKLIDGFPQFAPLGGNVHFAPAVCNIDGTGDPEIIITSRTGANAIESDGTPFCCGWPNLWGVDCYSAPAAYDINGDGLAEIAIITDNELEVFDCYGARLEGFPKYKLTGYMAISYPTPLMADLDFDGQHEILWISMDGHVYAYRPNGMPYFASLDGEFANTESGYFFGSIVPFLFCVDLEDDGENEVIAGYSSAGRDGCVYVWQAKNGQPRSGSTALVRRFGKLRGGCIADFNQDGEYDIGLVGRTSTDTVFAAIIDGYGNFLPGWPKLFTDRWQYLVNFPAAGDIDQDGYPDLVFSISSLDNGEIYVLRYDGTAYTPHLAVDGSYFAATDGTLGCVVLGDVSGDGAVDIVARVGSVFPGVGYERVIAVDKDGEVIDGWPIHTYAPQSRVLSTIHTPVLTDIDRDGYLDLICSSDDDQVYVWKLDTPYDPDNIPWGRFLHDSRNSGILPGRGALSSADESDQETAIPSSFSLSQNYPNPFNPTTMIEFDLRSSMHVNLQIFNILGQHVTTLIDAPLEPGRHQVIWDGCDYKGNDAASGLYFYRIQAGSNSQTRKMVKLN